MHEWREKLIKAPLLRQDRSKQSTKLKAATTINRETAVLKAALNLALRDGYGTSDAAWRYKLAPLKGAIGRRDVYLDANDRRRLIAHASADCAILVKAMSLLPLRPGAVANLVVANFDKRLSVLSIGKDKAGQDRKITLPVSTAEFLMEQSKDKLPNAPLLARAGGGAWNKDSWKHPIKDAAIAAGLPLATTAYAIRHSVITDLVAEHQLDTMTVARLSGTSVMMIDRFYGHLRQQYASEALAKLAL